jgi:hypothetical protein
MKAYYSVLAPDTNFDAIEENLRLELRIEAEAMVADGELFRTAIQALRCIRRWAKAECGYNPLTRKAAMPRMWIDQALADPQRRTDMIRRAIDLSLAYELIYDALAAMVKVYRDAEEMAMFVEVSPDVHEAWADAWIEGVPEATFGFLHAVESRGPNRETYVASLAGWVDNSLHPQFHRVLRSAAAAQYRDPIGDGFNDTMAEVAVHCHDADAARLRKRVGDSLRAFYGLSDRRHVPLEEAADLPAPRAPLEEELIAKEAVRLLNGLAGQVLSPQEYAVFRLMGTHMDREIGAALHLAVGTVGSIKFRIRRKMKPYEKMVLS